MTRAAFLLALLLVVGAHGQPPAAPRPEPVAETKLLMEAMALPNVAALGKLLKDKPADADGWRFARGQSLLLAETGNLLLLRPPRAKAAQETWLARAADLRSAATRLATAAGTKDYAAARAGLTAVATACNRCHESFRVAARVTPFDGD